ncbi:MAG: ABC transporter ATP-binding protein [Pirellulales bacterium]
MEPSISLSHVSKRYSMPGGRHVDGLLDVSLSVARGQFVSIQGPSGSGKTTLLLTIGGMQRPTSGQVVVAGHDLYSLGQAKRTKFRAAHLGFVFQMFHLVPYLNVIENICLGAAGQADARQHAQALIEQLGLTDRQQHRPSHLSVGECQRTALARALIACPDIILADEPTGNLDPDNTAEVLQVLTNFCHKGGAVLLVSHGEEAHRLADRVLRIEQGRIEEFPKSQIGR